MSGEYAMKTAEQSATGGGELPVLAMLKCLSGGEFLARLDEQAVEVARACEAYGKPGEIVVRLKFAPEGRTMALDATSEIKKKPRPRLDTVTTFFVDREGRLSRHDPEQMDAFPRGSRGVAVEPE